MTEFYIHLNRTKINFICIDTNRSGLNIKLYWCQLWKAIYMLCSPTAGLRPTDGPQSITL